VLVVVSRGLPMKNDMPNLNLLAVFTAVMELGSLSKAAEHFNTNQSTISTALSRLKDRLQQDLFIRKGRGVVPTAYSNSLYEQVKEPISQLSHIFEKVDEFDPKESKRKFVISAPEHLQWSIMSQFSKEMYPNLSLEVYDQPVSDEKVYEGLTNQVFDVMIDISLPVYKGILSQKLQDGSIVVICSAGHPRIKGKISIDEFMDEHHAVLELTRYEKYGLSHFSSVDTSQRKVAYHGRSLYSNMVICSQSEFITVVPKYMAMQFKDRLNLQVLTPPFDSKPLTSHLIWLKKLDRDPGNIWLREQLFNLLLDIYSETKDI
jgi:DNA-binding transcriptional LysR family regulator